MTDMIETNPATVPIHSIRCRASRELSNLTWSVCLGTRRTTRAPLLVRHVISLSKAKPAFTAKNRFAMPEKIAIPANFNFSELTKYWSQPNEV